MKDCAAHLAEKWQLPTSQEPGAWQALMQDTIMKQVPKGHPIFEESEELDGLYVIHTGACKFFTLGHDDQEHIYRLLGTGEMMGKRSVITDQGAMVAATALTDTQLCFLPKKALQELLSQDVAFSNRFTALLVEDMNQDERLKPLFCAHRPIKARLAQLLLFIADKYGTDRDGKLDLPIKREDMAALLGTSPEYIIHLLSRFKSFGSIALSKRNIYILSKTKLQEVSA